MLPSHPSHFCISTPLLLPLCPPDGVDGGSACPGANQGPSGSYDFGARSCLPAACPMNGTSAQPGLPPSSPPLAMNPPSPSPQPPAPIPMPHPPQPGRGPGEAAALKEPLRPLSPARRPRPSPPEGVLHHQLHWLLRLVLQGRGGTGFLGRLLGLFSFQACLAACPACAPCAPPPQRGVRRGTPGKGAERGLDLTRL